MGGLTISLDLEIGWGRLDDPDASRFRVLYQRTPAVVEGVLELFEDFEIEATWAVVGRLLQSQPIADPVDLSTYYDRCSVQMSYLAGRGMIDGILAARPRQDVGSHSFEHLTFDDPRCSEPVARADFTRARALFAKEGLDPVSFVYPRNRVAYVGLLSEFGFRVVRGPVRSRFDRFPRRVASWVRQLDYVAAVAPPVGGLEYDAPTGTLVSPGHMLFRRHYLGLRRLLPMSLVTARAVKGLKDASRLRSHFHLWFHPSDFGYATASHIRALREVLQVATDLRERGRLEILPMRDLPSHVAPAR